MDVLNTNAPVRVGHRLESSKVVRRGGTNQGNADHHAYLFAEAISRPEITAPNRRRLFTSAVTASDYRDRGRPSAWSSVIDRLASDADGAGAFPRLIVQAAGNCDEPSAWNTYPASLSTNLVHDPGQAWNSVTVGAFTEKTNTEDLNLHPVASSGALSPFTTTSMTWDPAWPLKPEVVFEGGNACKDEFGAVGNTSLNLLTTNAEHATRLFVTSNATSSASALCGKFAAELMTAYPTLRPETIRALLVHSAKWSAGMRAMHLPQAAPTKADYVSLIRNCGWGIPDLSYALWSAGSSLTLVAEGELHPYRKENSLVKTRDMHLHALPWPKEKLEELQDEMVEMRVTLSYFIEPNPSTRGSTSKFHYPSHRLRFDVQRPLDSSTEDFVARLNAAAIREEGGDPINPKDPDWILGDRLRHRGSLHQDVWIGTAAELASRGFIAIYPAGGWWRTRPALGRYDLPCRYSLVVSIQTREVDVDLYTSIEQEVAARAGIAIRT